MTILSIAAFGKGKNGTLHWSRQFQPIQKSRIDAILYAFPKLHYLQPYHSDEGTGTGSFLESDSVRYVYYSAFDVMFVLVTTKLSNLSSDQHIIQLVSRLVHAVCYPSSSHYDGSGISQQDLNANLFKQYIFEIFCALDELIEYGGYPAEIGSTIESIQTALLMESHEEHRYNLQQAGKLKEAKLKSSQRAAEIERSRKLGGPQSSGDPELDARIVGMGSGSGGSSNYRDSDYSRDDHVAQNPSSVASSTTNTSLDRKDPAATSSLGFDGSKLSFAKEEPKTTVVAKKTIGVGGKVIAGGRKLGATKGKMVLGKKTVVEEPEPEETPTARQEEYQPAAQHEQKTQQESLSQAPRAAATGAATATPAAIELGEIDIPHVKVEEQIQIQLDVDNTIQSFSVQGKLSLILPTSSSPNYAVQLNPVQSSTFGNALKLQTRPGLDKEQWNGSAILYNTDPQKLFNTGPTKPNILFQWNLRLNQSTAASLSAAAMQQLVPFEITHWVSSNSPGFSTVSIELVQSSAYTSSPHTAALQNIIVAIPCPVQPAVSQVDKPWKYDQNRQLILWSLGSLSTQSHQVTTTPDMGSKCAIEFDIKGDFEQEAFLPMQLKLIPSQSLVNIAPLHVYDTTTSQPVEFNQIKEINVGSFQIIQGQ